MGMGGAERRKEIRNHISGSIRILGVKFHLFDVSEHGFAIENDSWFDYLKINDSIWFTLKVDNICTVTGKALVRWIGNRVGFELVETESGDFHNLLLH